MLVDKKAVALALLRPVIVGGGIGLMLAGLVILLTHQYAGVAAESNSLEVRQIEALERIADSLESCGGRN